MRKALRQLFLQVIETDTAAESREGEWLVPCLHCRRKLAFSATGEPLGHGTLEHIVPRSWFGKRAAADLVAAVGSANALCNLALACASCNHEKGYGPDVRGPVDARAREVVETLLGERARRFRGE